MMKMPNLPLKRGIDAEKRFLHVARLLKDELPWLRSVKRTGSKLDQLGIDASIFISPLEGKGDVKIPVQIKSSFAGLRTHWTRHPESVTAGVLVVVVNENYSDESLKDFLKVKLESIRRNGKNFHDFFAAIRAQAIRSFTRVPRGANIYNFEKYKLVRRNRAEVCTERHASLGNCHKEVCNECHTMVC